jgi:hypothetical protein
MGSKQIIASCAGTSSSSKVTVVSRPCGFTLLGPADVPGLSKYKYRINLPVGKTPTNIQWHLDKPSAAFEGPTDQTEVTVTFKNTTADWIKLKASFNIDGKANCAEKQIALVKVDVGAATFTNPGRAIGSATGQDRALPPDTARADPLRRLPGVGLSDWQRHGGKRQQAGDRGTPQGEWHALEARTHLADGSIALRLV